jgi:hypothetical protein
MNHHGYYGAEDEEGFQAAVPSYSHSSCDSDEDTDVGVDWKQREEILIGMRSPPLRAPTHITEMRLC